MPDTSLGLDEEVEARLLVLIAVCEERGETELLAVLLTVQGMCLAGALRAYLPVFEGLARMCLSSLESVRHRPLTDDDVDDPGFGRPR